MRSFNRFIALTVFPALLVNAGHFRKLAGPLKAGAQELRILLQIAKSDNGEWRATMLSIDQSPDRGVGVPTTSFLLDGSSTLRRLPRAGDHGRHADVYGYPRSRPRRVCSVLREMNAFLGSLPQQN